MPRELRSHEQSKAQGARDLPENPPWNIQAEAWCPVRVCRKISWEFSSWMWVVPESEL